MLESMRLTARDADISSHRELKQCTAPFYPRASAFCSTRIGIQQALHINTRRNLFRPVVFFNLALKRPDETRCGHVADSDFLPLISMPGDKHRKNILQV